VAAHLERDVELPFSGRMNHKVFTTNADIGASEMTECRSGSDTGCIDDVTIVVQHVYIDSDCPHSQTSRDTQRLCVNAARFPQTVL